MIQHLLTHYRTDYTMSEKILKHQMSHKFGEHKSRKQFCLTTNENQQTIKGRPHPSDFRCLIPDYKLGRFKLLKCQVCATSEPCTYSSFACNSLPSETASWFIPSHSSDFLSIRPFLTPLCTFLHMTST